MDQRHGDISEARPSAGLGFRGWIALGGFVAIAAYFLWTEHRAHVIQLLPWAFLALCPLMHLFMHGGHGGHDADPRGDAAGRPPR